MGRAALNRIGRGIQDGKPGTGIGTREKPLTDTDIGGLNDQMLRARLSIKELRHHGADLC
jgi:hypothetical protein